MAIIKFEIKKAMATILGIIIGWGISQYFFKDNISIRSLVIMILSAIIVYTIAYFIEKKR